MISPAPSAMTLNTTLKLTLRCCPARTRHSPTGAADRTHTAVRARDDFIAIAAHELRNPMTPILGMTEIALRGVRNAKGVSPQRMITLLEALQSAVQSYVERATRLLD